MASFLWLYRRLKAMSVLEVTWRISQKEIQFRERKKFKSKRTAVIAEIFNKKLGELRLDAERMHLVLDNKCYTLGTQIPLLGGYDYEAYRKRWDAGFQTNNYWPDVFSYDLEYKQRDEIGDARTNWELNRHFQFAILAKNFRATGDKKYLQEFQELFCDWNEKNPFLWGISWTSVMEVAIRCSNWCYAYCFFQGMDVHQELQEKLRIGILNMTDYIAKHYSRYSSANNHLIVEAYVIGQSGILFDYHPWIKMSVDILTRELPLQNYSDGVNKELSLHYQSFYMEAMGLTMRLLMKNGIMVPQSWYCMLDKMCQYVANCMGMHGEVVVFGDDDAGKILDLHGGLNHYQYVLGLFTYLLDKQYVDLEAVECENLNWLFTKGEMQETKAKQRHEIPRYICYKEGGNSILRGANNRVLIGIDHAALGFGSIAAHGHADALSFQMYVDGKPVFVDPGTYIYHCDLKSRNMYRKTENHNTVCVDGENQSEMLGAFLWGKKAECTLVNYCDENGFVSVEAEHNGYDNVQVVRKYTYNGNDELVIEDFIKGRCSALISFILAPDVKCEDLQEGKAILKLDDTRINMSWESNKVRYKSEEVMCSHAYGIQEKTTAIRLLIPAEDVNSCKTSVTIE